MSKRRDITLGLGLISAASLAFEITLTRLFAVQQFYHFAFLVVSLAVMGFAASGVVLAAQPKHPPLQHLALAFAAACVLVYATINLLPFDSYSIAWDRKQVGVLLLYFLVATAPFFFTGWTVGACLADAGSEAHRPYAANLIGSAVGCPIALAALALLGGEGAVALAIVLGLLSALVLTPQPALRTVLGMLSIITLLIGIFTPTAFELRLSPYKALSMIRLAPDADTTLTHWSTSSRVDVVESSTIHVFPGLSMNASVTLPTQASLFTDGDGPSPISAVNPNTPDATKLASFMPASLAYELYPQARTLILRPGGGLDAVIALAAGASHVTAVFDDPLIPQLLAGPYSNFTHGLLTHPRVSISNRTMRGALHAGDRSYDVIVFSLREGYRPVTSGAFSLTENFGLTVESLRQAYRQLSEGGLLVVTRWLGTPPNESARAWATLLEAILSLGVEDPSSSVIAFRGMRTATMIASSRPFSQAQLNTTRAFLDRNGYDPIHLPDLQPHELNRYNQLPQDAYHALFAALIEDPHATISYYDFNLEPPTDNRPFFFHFFRWRQTPEVLASLGLNWQPFGGSGYLVLLALLGLMLLLAIPLAVAPLIVTRRRAHHGVMLPRMVLYFGLLGAGYLLVEIPLIQRLTLLLDRPTIAFATVLFTLLIFSGIGSNLSPRLDLRKTLGALVSLLVLLTMMLPGAIQLALPWSLMGRLALAFVCLAPIGLLMGVPFAAGLRHIEGQFPGMIPSAWAINGAVSGICGVLSAMLALDLGLSATFAVGALSYLGALLTAPMREINR
jgi:hypothetical protein